MRALGVHGDEAIARACRIGLAACALPGRIERLAADPLVMLASLIGKYVRELLMSQITGFYQARIPSAPNASGYHDPVTAKFVQLPKKQRTELRISDECFERFGPKNPSQKVTKAPRRARSAATRQSGTLPGLESHHK